jgi:hypothetical protein
MNFVIGRETCTHAQTIEEVFKSVYSGEYFINTRSAVLEDV